MFAAFTDFLFNTILPVALKIVIAVAIIAVCFAVIKKVLKKLKSDNALTKLSPSVKSFLISFLDIGLRTIVIVTVAAYLGVPIASLVAVIGSIGLALGLALQGGLANIAGGIMILIFKPFSVGHFIEVSGNSGTVSDIGLFYTNLTTADNRHVVLPNSVVTGSTLINYSIENLRRLDLEFSVSYSANIDLVKKVLLATAANNEYVLEDPAPEVMLSSHADSAIIFKLRIWTASDNYWKANFGMLEDVKRAFDKFSIEIPYPQIDIHMDKENV